MNRTHLFGCTEQLHLRVYYIYYNMKRAQLSIERNFAYVLI